MVHPGHVQIVQQQIRDAQHIGELLLLNPIDGLPVLFRAGSAFHLLLQLLQPTYKEAAGATGEIGHTLPDSGTDHLGHKVSNGPGRVKLTGGTGALQFLQNRLVDFPKGVAFLIVAQIQLINYIDYLPEQYAVLHVVVRIGKGRLHNGLSYGGRCVNLNAFDFNLAFAVFDICPF